MASDFGEFMHALMEERAFDLKWKDEAILGVVVAAEGYPGDVEKGNPLPELNDIEGEIYHAGTKFVNGQFVGNGGRVLLIAAEAATLKEAQQKVYTAIGTKEWDKFFFRNDIGWRTFK